MDSMDRKIEKKKGIALAFTKKALPFWGAALLLVFILWLIFRDDSKKLRKRLYPHQRTGGADDHHTNQSP